MPSLGVLRAIAGLAVVLLLTVDQGTWALWSDSGTVPGGPIRTGRLDVRVNGQDALADYAPLDLPQLVPGQTAAAVLTVSNDGNVPLTWTASTAGTNAGNGLLGALILRLTDATSTGGSTCGGSALPGSATTAGGALLATARTLAPGASEQVCVQVGLPAGASSALAAAATDLTISVEAATGSWSDTADIAGVGLAAVPLTPPTVTCTGVLGLNLTMTWAEVPGAREYRVFDVLGALIQTVPAGGLLQATLGALTGATVKTVFGDEWVSPGAGC
ncbi:SipW-dependent-type signal peptide-containing protein [Nocardioides sp.]|uniref:SipW-dependent-type signal peptide-containing protein n=1 Tax=Nocardioides sp. TaxID=35761 RepID=UPI002EDA4569